MAFNLSFSNSLKKLFQFQFGLKPPGNSSTLSFHLLVFAVLSKQVMKISILLREGLLKRCIFPSFSMIMKYITENCSYHLELTSLSVSPPCIYFALFATKVSGCGQP